jgi:signal transduction histidine kinase
MIRHELGQSADSEALSGMLANLESALRQTIRVVRDLTGEQLPSVLKTFGVAGALRQLAAEPGSSIELTVAGDEPELDLSQRLCLHQIVQALLQRIRRHAGATRIELVAMFESHRMEILFEHDGSDVMRALTPDDSALVAIKGRISLLSGRLLFSRSAGEGPRRVRLVVPLPVHSGEISPPTSQSTELP